jgi:hypothetical protein
MAASRLSLRYSPKDALLQGHIAEQAFQIGGRDLDRKDGWRIPGGAGA